MVRKSARGLAVPLVPAGHMMQQHNGRKRPRAQRPRKVGVDLAALKAQDGDRFGEHAFVHVGLIHRFRSSSTTTLIKIWRCEILYQVARPCRAAQRRANWPIGCDKTSDGRHWFFSAPGGEWGYEVYP